MLKFISFSVHCRIWFKSDLANELLCCKKEKFNPWLSKLSFFPTVFFSLQTFCFKQSFSYWSSKILFQIMLLKLQLVWYNLVYGLLLYEFLLLTFVLLLGCHHLNWVSIFSEIIKEESKPCFVRLFSILNFNIRNWNFSSTSLHIRFIAVFCDNSL